MGRPASCGTDAQMIMLRGDGTGHTSGAEHSVEAFDNSIEPQFDQLAHAVVLPSRIGGADSRCMVYPFGMMHVYAWYSSSKHPSD